jgi:hypothetical protein
VNANRRTKVRLLRELVEHGAYRVDPDAVADAIVQRVSGVDMAYEYARVTPKAGRRRGVPVTPVTTPIAADRTGTRLAA